MTWSNIRGIATVAIVALAVTSASTVASGQTYERVRLQQDVDRAHDIGVVGVLADLRSGDRRVQARGGVARLGTAQPVPFDAQIRVASATKTFVATVVLQLVGERRLSLADTVDRWLPGVVSGNDNDGTRITVRQLLQMTSGLVNPDDVDLPVGASEQGYRAHRYDSHTDRELVAMAMRHPPAFTPGRGWNYANTNYVLAGMIIEKVTGRRWQDEVTGRIIVPLGLSDTITPGTNPFIPGRHTHGYRQFTAGGPLVDTTELNPSVDGAAGGIISTTTDLARFLTALVTGKLLGPNELSAMQHTVKLSPEYEQLLPGTRYGLGLMWFTLTCGGGYWTHWGDTFGFSTRGGVTPDGHRSIIVATNSNGDPLQARDHTALHPLVDHALCAR